MLTQIRIYTVCILLLSAGHTRAARVAFRGNLGRLPSRNRHAAYDNGTTDPWDAAERFNREHRQTSRRGDLSGAMWSSALATRADIEDISRTVKRRVTYRPDVDADDRWQVGGITWQRGAGDCEDFAACVRDLCKANGHDADIVVFYARSLRKAHAVCIGTEGGQMWMSSNGTYTRVDSMQDATRHVTDAMGWHGVTVTHRTMSPGNHEQQGSH